MLEFVDGSGRRGHVNSSPGWSRDGTIDGVCLLTWAYNRPLTPPRLPGFFTKQSGTGRELERVIAKLQLKFAITQAKRADNPPFLLASPPPT